MSLHLRGTLTCKKKRGGIGIGIGIGIALRTAESISTVVRRIAIVSDLTTVEIDFDCPKDSRDTNLSYNCVPTKVPTLTIVSELASARILRTVKIDFHCPKESRNCKRPYDSGKHFPLS